MYLIVTSPGIKNKITVEVGNDEIDVSDFIYINSSKYQLLTDLENINFNSPGERTIYIKYKDMTYESKLIIVGSKSSAYEEKLPNKKDKEPPLITGVEDKTVFIGDSISYRRGVEATDSSLGKLEINIDSSNVNLKQEGKYEVIYSAIDKNGNSTEKSATINVIQLDITEEIFEETIEEVLSKIISPNMSKKEEAYEIYKWTKDHIIYTRNEKKDSWKDEAYRGIKKGHGDCFTSFSVAKALLSQAGIDNRDITRLGGDTKHYWHLINVGDGWYHFDTTRHLDKKDVFMLTDDELEELNKTRKNYYYNFDKSLYPRTP